MIIQDLIDGEDAARAAKKVKAIVEEASAFTGGVDDAARFQALVESSKGSSRKRRQSEITEVIFDCSKQQKQIIRNLVGDLIIENPDMLSFSLVNTPQFRQLLALFGIPPIDRRWVAGAHLNAAFGTVEAELKELLKSGHYQLSTDCWKKNNVNDKQKLIGFNVNHSNGKSALIDVGRVVSGESVTGNYLMEAIDKVIIEQGDPKKCLGVISDREASVQKALRDLEVKYPWMINLPCQAHSLNLVVKDLRKSDKLIDWVLTMSHNIVLWCSRPDVRAMLRIFQREEYGKEKRVEVGVETRFGTYVRELNSVVETKKALVRLASEDKISSKYQAERLAGKKEYVAAFGAVSNVNFWTVAEETLSLLNPLNDLIHHIEADRPYVSQVYRIWNQFGQHGEF